jgi:dihydrofolate synthase/folylpolyglutamate synthase
MSTVLMVITLLQNDLPVSRYEIDMGLKNVKLTGRIQIMEIDGVTTIFDVSHNPAAILHLKDKINLQPISGKTYAIFSMLKDKDIEKSISMIRDKIDYWYVAPLQKSRAAGKALLEESFKHANIQAVCILSTIDEAYEAAKSVAKPGDRMIVFGSFGTVAAVLTILNLTL